MAYTTIDDPTIYFNTKLYTGNGSSGHAISGVGFQPDWVWIKNRGGTGDHALHDAIRGATNRLKSNNYNAEATASEGVQSFDSDGFTLGDAGNYNGSSGTYASWNWLAGGTAPAITYTVKVVSDSGNKYRFDDFGTSAVTLDLQEGGTYTFDQSDSSNSGHPLRFSTTSNGTHGGGSEYTTGVTTTGTPGNAGAKTVITVAASAPTLYYYCTQHSAMGGQANTNSTFGSSNFSGSIQSTVSANTTAGFSVGIYNANATAGSTVGHGLGDSVDWLLVKSRNANNNWAVFHKSLGATKAVYLDQTSAQYTDGWINNTAPSSSVFTLSGGNYGNASGYTPVFYAFAEKKGYSKFGSYTGNGNADGTFVYTGFLPAWVMIKRTDTTSDWNIMDNKRAVSFNPNTKELYSNSSQSEATGGQTIRDYLSNGFKLRGTSGGTNASGGTYIYMAFAESPFTNSNGVPTNAR